MVISINLRSLSSELFGYLQLHLLIFLLLDETLLVEIVKTVKVHALLCLQVLLTELLTQLLQLVLVCLLHLQLVVK